MKRILILLLALITVLSIVSCGSTTPPEECEHRDANGDGACDVCGESISPSHLEHTDLDYDGVCDECGVAVENAPINVNLIENGEANFKFVLAKSGISGDVRASVAMLCDSLGNIGIDVEMVTESTSNISECEILIGEVTTRGERYTYDGYSLGKEGYAIVGIDNKLIITAGSSESISFALEVFTTEVLCFIEGETKEIDNLTFTSNIVEKQNNYTITSLTICGKDIEGYTIATNKRDSLYTSAALEIQDAIYTYTGKYLPIVDLDEGEKSIILDSVDYAGEEGFRITTTETGALHIECAYNNMLKSCITSFLNEEIRLASGNIDFGKDYIHTQLVSIITYEQYGAKGDGRTDDFDAIYKAHTVANEGGQTVIAKSGAVYYLKNITTAIPITTGVIWEGAEFIIDDTNLSYGNGYTSALFSVKSEYAPITLEWDAALELFPEGKIDKDNLSINWNYDFPAIVIIYNVNHKNYIRWGSNTSEGAIQQEIIKVDKDGNISADTPLLFDYEEVTGVRIIRTDCSPITLKGGKFTTYASQIEKVNAADYLSHGISISRSNTTFDSVKHYVKNELDKTKAHPYSGFFSVQNADSVTLVNCVLTGRTGNGAYGLSVGYSNNVLLKNCTQSNFYKADGVTPSMHGNEYWGIMGSNYCKNVTFDTCMLSRFDAHQGIYNAKIINSTINAIEVIGGGKFLIENTTFVLSRPLLVDLRSDYGSTFKGEITIRNCHVINYNPKNTSILNARWVNINFGYITHMPNLIIDGLTFDKLEGDVKIISIYAINDGVDSTYDTINQDTLFDAGVKNNNPYQPFEYVKVLNNTEGYRYTLYDAPYFYGVETEGVEVYDERQK